MAKATRRRSRKVPTAAASTVSRRPDAEARGGEPAYPEKPQPDVVRVTLTRYVVHEEDDGLSGNGVDLYMGYLMSSAVTRGGTTTVMGGLTKNNGGQPRNSHDVHSVLFSAPLPAKESAGDFAVARLHLIESDQSTGLVQQAFNAAVLPNFSAVAPPNLTQADLPIFYLVPFGFIARLLAGSNTDDDYGHWDLIFAAQDNVITCKAFGGTPECHVQPSWFVITPSSQTPVVLTYVDDDNDIDCVLSLSLAVSDAAMARWVQDVKRAEHEHRAGNSSTAKARAATR